MTPQELDSQSSVKIDRWIDVHSPECKEIDGHLHSFTLRCMKIGFEDGFMHTDMLGRIWGRNRETGEYYPFHTEYGYGDNKQLIGYRLSSKAAN